MRSNIFVKCFNYLDYYFHIKEWKVLLLIDNAGSHFNPKILDENNNTNLNENDSNSEEEEEIVAESSNSAQNRKRHKKSKQKTQKKKKPDIKLTNIELVYLPPNTTAHLQPMDAGIIHSFKSKYKREFCRHLIQQFDKGIDREKLSLWFLISYLFN